MLNDDPGKDKSASTTLTLQIDDNVQRSARGGHRLGAGRKRVQFDLAVIEKLSAIGCTNEEIAGVCGCSVRTLEMYLKKPEFTAAKMRGLAKCQISMRRLQWKAAEKGDVRMLIFLGKQFLGQREELPIDGRVSDPYGRSSMVPPTRLAVEQAEASEERMREVQRQRQQRDLKDLASTY